MADTSRSKSTLLTSLFPDGRRFRQREWTPFSVVDMQEIRDLITSFAPPFMGLYVSTPTTTTITTQSVYVKVAGTTTVTNKSDDFDDDSGTSNRARFIGVSPRHMHVVAQASVAPVSGTNQEFALQVWHYDDSAASGSYLAHSIARTTLAALSVEQITTHADVMMDTNDYLEIHIANNSSTVDVNVENLYLFAVGMIV